MKLILKKQSQALDASRQPVRQTVISAGTHEVERIPNPLLSVGTWIVLKGTKIGIPEDTLHSGNAEIIE